jgi:hypothetical protein
VPLGHLGVSRKKGNDLFFAGRPPFCLAIQWGSVSREKLDPEASRDTQRHLEDPETPDLVRNAINNVINIVFIYSSTYLKTRVQLTIHRQLLLIRPFQTHF